MARIPGAEVIPQASAQTGQPLARAAGSVRASPVGSGIAAIANVGEDVVNLAQTFADAENRINARRDSVERLRVKREFKQFGTETFNDFSSSDDLSKQSAAEGFGTALNEKMLELIENHSGSEESKLRLMEQLEPVISGFADRAAGASVKAQDAMVSAEFDEAFNDFAARARQGEDPGVLIAEGDLLIEEGKDAIRPGQEIAFTRTLRARVYGAKVNDFIAKGAHDEAEKILAIPEVRSSIGEAGQRSAFDRIAKARQEGTARILTEPETMKLGFPKGVIVQKKGDGSFNVVFKPEKDDSVRAQKIHDLTERGVDPQRAQDLVDGNIRLEVVPGLGVVREVNEVDGTAREVKIDPGQAPAEQPEQQASTLFELAQSGAIAGIVPAALEFAGETAGQIPGIPVATDVIQKRQELETAKNELIRALSINPRFPVAEITRIREEIKIEPRILDSKRALLSRMAGIDRALRVRLENERRSANNTALPQDTRGEAAQSAQDIENFLNRLGIPEGFDPDQAIPEGVPDNSVKIGVTKGGKDVWESPDGKRWVVE